MIDGMKDLQYEERITALELETIQERLDYLDLVEVFKIHNGMDKVAPMMFKVMKRDRTTRSTCKLLLEVGKASLDNRENGFRIRGAKSWNKLPSQLQAEKSLTKFKVNLKKHFDI